MPRSVEVVEVAVDLVPPGAGPLLSAVRSPRCSIALTGQPSLIAAGPMGRRTILGGARTTTFLAEYDVEVAQA